MGTSAARSAMVNSPGAAYHGYNNRVRSPGAGCLRAFLLTTLTHFYVYAFL